MLRETSVDSVVTLAKKCVDAGVVIEALPNSPLSEAIHACYSPTLDVGAIPADMSIFDVRHRLLEASRAPGVDNVVKHDVVMDELVGKISETVQFNLNLAKNVVNPIVQVVAEEVERALHDAEIKSANILSVLPDFYKPIWTSPVFAAMVERYAESPIADVEMKCAHPVKTIEELTEMAKTGAARFDSEVEEWLKDMPADFLADVYSKLFACNDPRGIASLISFIGPDANRDDVLAAHLLARKLKADIQDGIEMELGDYREYMAKVVEQTGRALCRILEKRERDLRMRTLIIAYPAVAADYVTAESGMIVVQGDVYNDWLEAGGCPEILFGAYLTDKNTGFNSLIEKADEYKRAWAVQANLLRTQAMSQKFNTGITALRNAITKQINAAAEDVLPTASRAPLHARLVEKLDGISGRQLEDIYLVSRDLVCDVLFAHTDAKLILAQIDDVARANPNMDIREAALLATIDYVSGWVTKLFNIQITAPLNNA